MKEKIAQFLSDNRSNAYTFEELATQAGAPAAAVTAALTELLNEGLAVQTKKKRYAHPNVQGLYLCTVVSLRPGYAFASSADLGEDFFIKSSALKNALPGDIVLVHLLKKDDRGYEGTVERIIKHNFTDFVGTFRKTQKGGEIETQGSLRINVFVPKKQAKEIENGDVVRGELKEDLRGSRLPEGNVTKVYGNSELAASCCQAILDQYEVPRSFPSFVMEEAKKVAAKGILPEELQERKDLRHLPIFTIDGADTKDIDDAVSVIKTEKGYSLGVHIADVSHYVRPGSALDKEAFARGTSVYYADSVVPMLPKELSNGICSLNPQEDRLAFSALMELDPSGKMIGYEFAKTVIRSRVKGVYSEINAVFDGSAGEELKNKYAQVLPELGPMKELAGKLKANRFARGGLDLESRECKIKVDEQGKVKDILPRVQGESEELIEDFMLMANEAAATYAQSAEVPFVYRVHPKPETEKVDELARLAASLGFQTRMLKTNPTGHAFADLLRQAQGTQYERLISEKVLRTMSKALYSEQHSGHFGLGLENYAHFTSPIRRYPDLSIHRILTDLVNGTATTKIQSTYAGFVKASSENSSQREIAATYCERDCEACYKAEYMADRIGQTFQGVVSSCVSHGLYVELDNTVEGLVRNTDQSLSGYDFDGSMSYAGPEGRYGVGDSVQVLVLGANVLRGQIDFAIIPFQKP